MSSAVQGTYGVTNEHGFGYLLHYQLLLFSLALQSCNQRGKRKTPGDGAFRVADACTVNGDGGAGPKFDPRKIQRTSHLHLVRYLVCQWCTFVAK